MKNILILGLMMVGMIVTAQDIKPEFKQLNDGVITATYFHDNGTIAQEGTFLNNKRHGEWTSYDNKGQKTALAEYKKGMKTGKWFLWNGDKLTEVDYQNNKIAAVNTWVDKNPVVSNRP